MVLFSAVLLRTVLCNPVLHEGHLQESAVLRNCTLVNDTICAAATGLFIMHITLCVITVCLFVSLSCTGP